MKVTIPGFVKWIFPKRIWEMPSKEKNIYLTFDDGPVPEVTLWVLEQLNGYNAKATFFCIGENIKSHPEIFKKICFEGHTIGNHTYNHLNGWKTSTNEYLLNSLKCQQVIKKNLPKGIPLKNVIFRPPYGKMKMKQAGELQKRDFKIVMWSIISMDFDPNISVENCYQNVVKNARPGSIIVFHDSKKAQSKLFEVLPKVLEHLSGKGYCFKALE